MNSDFPAWPISPDHPIAGASHARKPVLAKGPPGGETDLREPPRVMRLSLGKLDHKMSLDDLIDSAIGRGRRITPMTASIARTLTPADLEELAQPGNSVPVPSVKELHASHHKLAQTLASGAGPTEASLITGYSTGRIQQLKDDPQFQELVAYYAGLDEQKWIDLQAVIKGRLASLSLDTIEVTHRRLQDNPNSFSAKELAAIAELGLDRIGHGKTSTQDVKHVHSIDEEQLARIRNAKDRPAEVSEEDRAALVSLALFATEGDTGAEETPGEQSAGSGVREEGREGTSEAARTVIDLPSVG